MQITLFEAAHQVREALEQTDPETGEISQAWLQSRALFENKALACVAYLLEEDAAIEAADQLIAHIKDKLQARKSRHARLRHYMAENMKAAGIHEIRHEAGLFAARLHIGRDESVELEEGAQFPPELCADPKPPVPSKSRIKAAIKAGQAVKGACLVRRDRLQIT